MERKQSNEATVNKTGMILFTSLICIIDLAYIIQFIKGEAGLGLFLPIELLATIPMVIGWIAYKLNPETTVIKHVMGIGYGLFYLVLCMISTNTILVFVYALPTVILTAMFNDFKFSVTSGIGVSIIATIHAIKFASMKNWEGGAVADLEIEVLIMIVCSVFSIVVNRVITKINASRIRSINEAGEKTNEMLEEIMELSAVIFDDVAIVSEKMNLLATSSEETLSAMQEIQSGATDTAESVQTQLYKTEEIQTQIDQVTKAADNIGGNVKITVDACHEGRDNIAKLISQAQASEEAGNGVVKEVQELKDSTTQMQSIVDLIQNVASQTSLLALNASIEAARAGEAGRGFAVVATEISNLASQTQTATGNINDLINNIAKEMEDVVVAINSLVDGNRAQNESAHVTQGSFEKIVDSIREIRDNSDNLSGIVGKLVKANEEIVESIQTISAISEEVSAHSNNTCDASEQNEVIVSEVQGLVEKLNDTAEQLKAMK